MNTVLKITTLSQLIQNRSLYIDNNSVFLPIINESHVRFLCTYISDKTQVPLEVIDYKTFQCCSNYHSVPFCVFVKLLGYRDVTRIIQGRSRKNKYHGNFIFNKCQKDYVMVPSLGTTEIDPELLLDVCTFEMLESILGCRLSVGVFLASQKKRKSSLS